MITNIFGRKTYGSATIFFVFLIGVCGNSFAQRPIPYSELDVSVWQRRGNTDGSGSGGEQNLIDPDKANTYPPRALLRTDPTDPSTWVVGGNAWQGDWQGQNYALTNHPSCPLTDDPWIIIDFGSNRDLEKMHIWNVSEATGLDRATKDFNLYFATSPTVPMTAWATSNNLYSSATDYDFQSGGWTQFGGTHTADRGGSPYGIDLEIAFAGAVTARYVGVEMKSNWGDSNGRAGFNAFVFTEIDTTPPGLTITDDDADDTIEQFNPINYTLTFTEDVDPATVVTGNLSNAGTCTYTVNSITQVSNTVYDVVIAPTTTGSLQLRVSSNVTDLAGNFMAADVTDVETITVVGDLTAPEVVSFIDNVGGGPMGAGQTVTYTVTFNEYINASTVEVGDFVNASGAVISVSSVTTGTLASIFYVDVTPTEAGFLQLRLSLGSVEDLSANTNALVWDDDTTITVASSADADGTWAVNANGNWSEVSNWETNIVARGIDRTATFPDLITSDRTITFDADETLGGITASDGDRNYYISGSSTMTLARTTGTPSINVTVSGRGLFLRTPVTGTNGFQKDGPGTVYFSSPGSVSLEHPITGDITVNNGTLRIDNYGLLGAGGDFSNNVSLAAGTELYVAREDPGSPQIFSGDISGGGSFMVARRDVVLSGNNTHRGYTHVVADTTRPASLTVSSINSVNGGTPLLPSSSMGCPTSVVDGTIQLGKTGARATCTLTYIGSGETTDRSVDIQCNQYSKNVINANGTGLLKFTGEFTAARAGLYDDEWGFILQGTGDGEIVDGIPVTDGTFEKRGSGTWTIGGPGSITVRSRIKDGTLILNGPHALGSGIVLVSGGTLSANYVDALGSNTVAVTNATLTLAEDLCMVASNDLHVGTTGTIQIDSGVRARVENLYTNNVLAATGWWGSPTSSADNKSALFSGTGKLYVGVQIPASGMLLIVR